MAEVELHSRLACSASDSVDGEAAVGEEQKVEAIQIGYGGWEEAAREKPDQW